MQRVIAETNERVDVSGWRRVRTCVSLSALNKNTWVFTSQPCPLPSFLRTLLHWLPKPGEGSRNAAAIMSSPSGSPFADVIQSLAGLHQEHHKALMDMRADQERRFCALVQNQREDRELFRSWMDREVRAGENPTVPAPPTHMPVQKMGPQDDPEAFLDLFEKTAAACGWPQTDWPVRLIPLLTGEAQLAAQQLPVQNLLVYDDLKRAILQRVGRSPEQHRQRFRSLELGENGRPFVMAHQLRDACRRWLLAGEGGVDHVIDQVVLEQFIARLPKATAQWVQCHRPASLDLAIQLAEDQMVACHGVGETLPSVSLSLSSPSVSPPIFLPRSRAGVVPRAQPRWRGGPAPESAAGRAHAREAGSASPSSALIPVPPGSPRQFLVPLPATRVAGKPGPACWRCGDPSHFIDRCPVMEVGTLVRVPDAPQAAPDQAGGYQIPVSIRGGTYWALVDSGCNQTSIHQSLIQPGALDKSCMVRVRCVHGDVVTYPVVLLTIQFRGQKHKVEVAVNPRLRHPLILGTNWPAFKILLGVLCVDASCGKEKPEGEATVRTGEAESGPAEAAPGERSAVERLILTERNPALVSIRYLIQTNPYILNILVVSKWGSPVSDCSNWRGDRIKAAVERQFRERDRVKTRAHELSERNSRNECREWSRRRTRELMFPGDAECAPVWVYLP